MYCCMLKQRKVLQSIKYCQAFTLVELLVVIAIVAILATIASAGFSKTSTSNRAMALSGKLTSSFKFARSEAQRTDKEVFIIPKTSFWGDGWKICSTEACSNESELIENIDSSVESNIFTSHTTSNSSSSFVRFSNEGIADPENIVQINICIKGETSGHYKIYLKQSGVIKEEPDATIADLILCK
ncbi:MAG: prepilin-type N-terminal cleavage/methylation domain-containing protein [Gammaproteobacteria bacterium]|nr:MAG: prepilin-type N-terminal cleavage/methylation domain-containing protein [Gammaproteobacteria bacterium]